MSLITDALQKAQRRPAFEPSLPNPPPQRPWWPAGLALGLLGLGLLWLRPPQGSSTTPPRLRPAKATPAAKPIYAPRPIMALTPVTPTAPAMTWRIEGVITGMGKPTAIINGQLVNEGDEIHGAKVVSVNTRRVGLLHQGEMVHLPLEEQE